MKKNIFRSVAGFLYLFSIIIFLTYVLASVNPRILLSPVARLVLLCSCCLAIYLGSLLISKTIRTEQCKKVMKRTFSLFFVIYLILISTFTLFDSYFGRSGAVMAFKWNAETFGCYIKNSLNIIPSATMLGYTSKLLSNEINNTVVITNIFGNLIAFGPFALFLPLLFKKINSFKKFFITMLCMVVLVELLQFAMQTGSCDIDDVILNVGGACIFYWVFHTKSIRGLINKLTMTTVE